jgi:cell division protein FtsW
VAGSEYRLKRVLAFLDPISHRYDEAYQLIQSLYGFAGGGFWGTGLGDGLQKFFFLPEAHNDFIAAIIAEEFGVIGIWMLLIVFSVLLARGVLIALRTPDEFGTYVAFGITILIGVQTLANLGVAMGLLPTKGLNLPFISAGGSALVVSLFSVGVLLNISKERYTASKIPRPSRPSTENQKHNGKRENR